MKKLLLLLTILIPSVAFAQALPIRNDTPTTLRDLGANLNVGRNFAVDQYGRLQCVMPAGVANTPVKLENGVANDGDAGIPAWSVRNEGAADFGNSNLDYNPISTSRSGAVHIQYSTLFNGTSPGKDVAANEDSSFVDADAVVKVGAQALSAIAQSVGTTGDVAPPSMDLGNRLVTTSAPAGETWASCSSAVTNTTPAAIKASVASNRIYMTSLTCYNNDDTATVVQIQDGSGGTVLYSNYLTTNVLSVPTFTVTFPNPLRTTSATGIFQVPVTTAANVVCCGSGYISTI